MGKDHLIRKAPASGKDYFPTPRFATYALTRRVDLPSRVWEPAAGQGWMAIELARFTSVKATDLYHYDRPVYIGESDEPLVEAGIDFLKAPHPCTIDDWVGGVVTNPPYGRGRAEAFVRTACAMFPFVAMFLRTSFLESEGRYTLFQEKQPTRVLQFSGRVQCSEKYFNKPVGGMISYAWFVWDYRKNENCGRTLLEWIDTKQAYEDWKESLN